MTKYIGKICEKHPELGGERHVYEGRCVGCKREKGVKDKAKAKSKRVPGITRHFGKICGKHPELNGERLVSNSHCVACHVEKGHQNVSHKYHNNPEWKEKYLIQRAVLKKKWNRYAEYSANYRAAKKLRTPKWADVNEIKEIYKEAALKGLTVDHIIPLQGEIVSGLHVENNLRIIPQPDNDSKGNKFFEHLL